MASVSLEKRADEEKIEESLDEKVYFASNRFSAAGQFAFDCVKENQKIVADFFGYYLCYSIALNSYFYSLFALNYSKENKGYTFSEKSKSRLKVVG